MQALVDWLTWSNCSASTRLAERKSSPFEQRWAMASLRAKLEPRPDAPQFLKTVHGIGYRLEMGDTTDETH